MDSPEDSAGWPSDLAAQVARLQSETEHQPSQNFNENSALQVQGIPTATLTGGQIQMFTQAGYNFSLLPQTSSIQTTETIESSQDINSLTEALQQQLQGLSRDINSWQANQSKIGQTTPSTVIINIDGTQQEIPISFHLDTSGNLPDATNNLNTENTADTIDDLNSNYQLEASYIKAEGSSTVQPQIIQTSISEPQVSETVELVAESTAHVSVTKVSSLPCDYNAATVQPSDCISTETENANENISNKTEWRKRAKKSSEDCIITSTTGVRKSSRLAKQYLAPKPKPMYDPKSEYDTSKIWCEECQCSYTTECPDHSLQPINDKVVLSRAWSSLPSVLQIFMTTDNELGVFSKKFIASRTKFGPFIGEVVKEKAVDTELTFQIDTKSGDVVHLDTTDEDKCNWMMFVRRAENYEEQNLVMFQYEEDLYFTSCKDIPPKEELKVWYAPHYAQRIGAKVHAKDATSYQDLVGCKFECSECDERLKTAALLEKHISEVHEESAERAAEDSSDQYKQGKDSGSSFQSWKKTKRFLYFSKIRKYRELKSRAEARRKEAPPVWNCEHCTLTFDNPTLLNIHNLTHAAEDRFDMTEEGEGEGNEALIHLSAAAAQINSENEKLRSLAESGVDGSGEIKCPCCSIVFSNSTDLILHTAVHAKTKKRRRNRYNRIFNPKKPYACQHCIKTFSSSERLQRHRLVHSRDDSHRKLVCSVCNKKFMNNSAMACHMKTHSQEKYYTCPVCREGFDQMHALKAHGQSHAVNGIFSCSHCNKTFYEFNSLRKHLRQYHPYKDLPCPYCDKVFPRSDKLKLHLLKHTNQKEFMCDQCGRQFKRKDKLKEHTKRMHDPKNPKTLRQYNPSAPQREKFTPKVQPSDYERFIYKCHTCLLGFKRRGMLVNHLAKRHPEVKPEQVPELNLPILRTQRDFFCRYCDKVYKSSSKRKAHIMKSHPGAELPASGRQRQQVGDGATMFDMHQATYSQLTGSVAASPFACEYCPKQYASKPKFLQHLRKDHPTKAPPKKSQVAVGGFPAAEKYVTVTNEKEMEVSDSAIVIQPQQEGQTADLLTQAMSELTQSLNTEYRSSPLTSQQPEYQLINSGSRPLHNIILQPTLLQTGTTNIDLTPLLQEVPAPEEDASATQPITILNGNQTQTFTLPLSLATQLITRSFIQSSPTVKIV